MIQETIEAVRKAETEAAGKEAQSAERADQIRKEAEQKALLLKQEMTDAAAKKAEKALSEAKARCGQMLLDAEEREGKEAARLEAETSGRRGQAVRAVIESLLGS